MTWIYARVSSKAQLAFGHSLEAQVEKCLAYCLANDLNLGAESNSGREGIFIDGAQSASKKKSLYDRAGGRAMLSVMRPGDHLVVTSPHRLWRSLRDAENQLHDWERAGVHLHFVDVSMRTDTANGRMMMQIFCAMAEWNSRIKSERIREGKKWSERRKKGLALPDNVEVRGLRRLHKGSKRKEIDRELDPEEKTLAQLALLHREQSRVTRAPFSGKIRAYIRVSTRLQSAELQRKEILEKVSRIPEFSQADVEFYDDNGFSAYKLPFNKRPEGKRLLDDMQPGDMVVCTRADRMCRSIHSLCEVLKWFEQEQVFAYMLDCGVRTDTQFGKTILTLLTMVAEMESYEMGISASAGVKMSILKNGIYKGALPLFLQPRKIQHLRKIRVRPFDILTEEQEMDATLEWYRLIGKHHCQLKKPVSPFKAAYMMNCRLARRYNLPRLVTLAHGHDGGKYAVFNKQVMEEAQRMQLQHGYDPVRHRLIELLDAADDGEYPGFFPLRQARRTYDRMHRWCLVMRANPDCLRQDGVALAEGRILSRLRKFVGLLPQ